MHRYLRAVGFSKIQKREEYEELVKFTEECYQTEETAVSTEGEDFSERRKAFAEQMGLMVRGVYDEKDEFHTEYCGLSVEGKVLMPVYQKMPVVSEIKASQERNRMIQAARDGDEDAIENLTLEDMDMYSRISRRISDEDVFSIVTTHFMPCGVECDHYNILGEILDVKLLENNKTGEKIYVLTIETNEILLDVCINQEDLMGEPLSGRRFRGIIWLQGLVHFEEKW